MGCINSTVANNFALPRSKAQDQWVNSPVGKLNIKIVNVYLKRVEDRDVRKSDLLVKVRVSNQCKVVNYPDIGKPNARGCQNDFAVNSCHKFYGRFLILEVWNKMAGSNLDTGLGFLNLNNIIGDNYDSQKFIHKSIRCFINYTNSPGGFLDLDLNFYPYSYEEITFKITSAFVQNKYDGEHYKTNPFTTKITIGEEVLESKQTFVNEKNQLKWENELLTFRVPEFINEGTIQIIEKQGMTDVFWGEYLIDIGFLLSSRTKQIEIDDELIHEGTVAGRIRISSQKGNKSSLTFHEIDSPRRRHGGKTSIKIIEDRSHTQKNICKLEESEEITIEIFPSVKEAKEKQMQKNNKTFSLPPLVIKDALKKFEMKRKKVAES